MKENEREKNGAYNPKLFRGPAYVLAQSEATKEWSD